MAQRHTFLVAAIAIALLSAVGCEQNSPAVASLPPPNFEGPQVTAPAPPPAPVAIRPQPAPVAPVPSKSSLSYRAPQVASGIPRDWVPPVAPRAWRWIVIHHSATTTGGAAAFDKMHRAKGWDELGYDFVIGNGTDTADGQIEVGPRWTKQKIGAHAKTPDNRFNEYGVGICLVGNFDVERPTPTQIKSLEKLTAYLMKTYHITPDRVIGHSDTKATDCPGKYMDVAMVRRQAAVMAGMGALAESRISPNTEMLTNMPQQSSAHRQSPRSR